MAKKKKLYKFGNKPVPKTWGKQEFDQEREDRKLLIILGVIMVLAVLISYLIDHFGHL